MAFSDPQSVTIGAATTSLPRTSSGNGTGTFTSADGTISVSISNSYGKRVRRTARITVKKLSTDPLTPSNNIPVSGSFYVVTDFPVQGFSATEQADQAKALMTLLTASSAAKLVQLLGGEA